MRGFGLLCIATVLSVGTYAQGNDDWIQAIRNNDLATLKARLAKGDGKDAHDPKGNTPLMLAAAYGGPQAVKLLLESGADVNARNELDATALILGAGNVEKARMLVEKGADVNAQSKAGRTPLLVAASCAGCSPTVKLLLEKGAAQGTTDKQGNTPLTLALGINDLESSKLLLAKGAGADVPDGQGYTPLSWAVSNCNLEAAKLLLSKGANPNTPNTAGGEVKFGKIQLIKITPLMFAAAYCEPTLVKTLLDAGAKVDATDIRNMTPLHFAVSSETQNPAVVKQLIQAGSPLNAKDIYGETALDWAKKFGSKEVIAALGPKAEQGLAYTAPKFQPAAGRSVNQAVERGSAILQTGAMEFFKQSGCVGCHHQPVASIALSAAREAGVSVDEPASKGLVKMIEGESMFFNQAMLERNSIGGGSDGPTWKLMALAEARYPGGPLTDPIVAYVAHNQHPDGSWRLGGVSRAPMEEGSMARTAMALRAMRVYGSPAMKAEFDARIARARSYLASGKALTNDEAAMQILGLQWAGGAAAKVGEFGKALAAAQHADGGWGQNRNLASDAYATGESLYALKEAGILTTSSPAYQKGVKFLLDTQWEDGSWYVRSRSPKFQPYFQSGFPHDHDQWISSAATSWAVRALAPAAVNEKRASR